MNKNRFIFKYIIIIILHFNFTDMERISVCTIHGFIAIRPTGTIYKGNGFPWDVLKEQKPKLGDIFVRGETTYICTNVNTLGHAIWTPF